MIVEWDTKISQLFEDFADENFQRRSWSGIGPEVSSPVEMCNWLDDVALSEWRNTNKSEIGDQLFQMICDFEKMVDELPDERDPLVDFSCLEWIQIRLAASVIRDLLQHKLDAT